MKQDTHTHNDEIDLIELFKTIWASKVFIIALTGIITAIAAVYVNMQTPIYEVKSVIQIGYTKSNDKDNKKGFDPIDTDTSIEQKIKFKFTGGTNNLENGFVSKTSIINGGKLIEVATQATNNDAALDKNKQVLEYLQQEYQYKIDEFLKLTDLKIKDTERKIKHLTQVETAQLEYEINKIKNKDIPRVEDEIVYIKNTQLSAIENKISQTKQTIDKYKTEIEKLTNNKPNDSNQTTLFAIQALNIQNLTINAQNQLDKLEQEKQYLSNFRLLDLEQRIENLQSDVKIKTAELEIITEDKTAELQAILDLEKSIAAYGFKNSELVSDYAISNSPIKPQKKKIIAVAFVFALFLSMLLALLIGFVRKELTKN